jgi:hypothetical protein
MSPWHQKKLKIDTKADDPMKVILNRETISLFDRLQLSVRESFLVLASFARSSGLNFSDLKLSVSTVYRTSLKNRNRIVEEVTKNLEIKYVQNFCCVFIKIKEEFKEKCQEKALIVHWDGKNMSNTTKDATDNSKNCERLAVAVSGLEIEKILGVPKLENERGDTQAEAVTGLLFDWGLADNILALSFDTTASNTGKENIFEKVFYSYLKKTNYRA